MYIKACSEMLIHYLCLWEQFCQKFPQILKEKKMFLRRFLVKHKFNANSSLYIKIMQFMIKLKWKFGAGVVQTPNESFIAFRKTGIFNCCGFQQMDPFLWDNGKNPWGA